MAIPKIRISIGEQLGFKDGKHLWNMCGLQNVETIREMPDREISEMLAFLDSILMSVDDEHVRRKMKDIVDKMK